MDSRIRVAVLFGGKSAEHEVSIRSAESVIGALDTSRYDVIPIGIDRSGGWHVKEEAMALLSGEERVALINNEGRNHLVAIESGKDEGPVDVVFPVLHGPYGEDGAVQGLLELARVPYVGADVLGSAVGMDKDVMKRLLEHAGIPTTAFRVFRRAESAESSFETLKAELGLPLFVKPANLGSSVGINRCESTAAFKDAVREAFSYDSKILVESDANGREIECSVLGNDDPIASIPGEIKPAKGFYSYEAKYVDENGAELLIPAPLDEEITDRVRSRAIEAYQALCCSGMARVDMFINNDTILVNEINTIPGFTSISMFPKLWEATGISYTDLLTRLIELAMDRHRKKSELKNEYPDRLSTM